MSSDNNKRIAKNTLMLYIRMLFSMGVSFFTSRIVLNALGVNDYGIYNVVGGIVVILGFLNSAMAGATQRFLNIELGKLNYSRLKIVFSTSIIIHILVAVVVLFIAETIGLWYLNTIMNIDSERISAANWVFQFSVLSFIINILGVPYNATIIAYEKMSAFAYISIMEVSLKLLVVFLLMLSPFDKLILYAGLIFIVCILTQLMYAVYSIRHFKICSLKKIELDKPMMKSMLSFSSWTIFGNLGYIMHTQGIALLINYFFGVAVNAAQGISNQVNGIVQQFVSNFLLALKPQVVKSYASGQIDEMHVFIIRGCQIAFYLVAFFAIPLVLEAPTILMIWLKIVPEYTVIFVRLVLIITLFDSFSGLLAAAKGATGVIKNYQITLSIIGLFHLPIAFIYYHFGYPPQYAMYIYLAIIIVMQAVRIWFVCRSIGLPISRFFYQVVLKCLIVLVLSSALPTIAHFHMTSSYITSALICILSFLSVGVTALSIGISKYDRRLIFKMIKKKLLNEN